MVINPMQMIARPGPRKQELLNKFFWLRSFLLVADRIGFDMSENMTPETEQQIASIETVWNSQIAYLQADDDEYNYNIALETYQMLENGFMSAGIDIDAGIKATMQRNGYTGFNQMKPTPARREIPDDFFEIGVPKPAGVGSIDPWN